MNTPPTSVHFATHYIPCSIVPLTVYTYIRMYIRTSLPPFYTSSIPPPFQSSLEVIISQNDNALGVFSLTETTFALNDDDQSSIMVTISRTGGQLEGVTVCLQMCVPQWSMTSEALHFIHQPLLSHTDIYVAINPILVHPPLPSPPLPHSWSGVWTTPICSSCRSSSAVSLWRHRDESSFLLVRRLLPSLWPCSRPM